MAEKPAVFDDFDVSFVAGGGISAGMRVKLQAAGTVVAADAADNAVGTARDSAVATESVTVRVHSAPSAVYLADSAIAVGDLVTGNTGGYVESAGVGKEVGIAYTAAAAINDTLLVVHI